MEESGGGRGKWRKVEEEEAEEYVRIHERLKSDIQNAFLQPLRGRIQQTR